MPDADELPRLEPVPGPGKTLIPVHIAANTQRKDGAVYTLLGDVEIRYKDYVLHADKMNYNEDTGEARAEGHVELDGGPADEHILADHATLNLNLDTGRFYNVTGSVGRAPERQPQEGHLHHYQSVSLYRPRRHQKRPGSISCHRAER